MGDIESTGVQRRWNASAKRMLAIAAAVVAMCAMLLVSGCSGSEEEAAPDLTGDWEQSNKNSEDSYMIATIEEDSITVYWYGDEDGAETTSLYWAGTYVAPTESGAYSWDSENDYEQTENALLSSDAETKTFTYEDGVLSFEVTALGTTTTVEMEQL